MNGFREACIINKPEQSAKAVGIQGFLKWIGVSYFTLISHEEDGIQNPILKKNEKKLDIIIYLEEDGVILYNCSSNPFREKINIAKTFENLNKNISSIVRKIYQKLMDVDFDEVFEKLISIYEQKNLSAELANIRYSIQMHTDDNEDVQQDYREQKHLWEDIVSELEQFRIQSNNLRESQEYLIHAIVYSKRKVNELCDLLNQVRKYETIELLEELDEIYKYDSEFYEVEGLKAKVVMTDSEYRLMSILYLQSCIEECKVDACRSFYYYRLGKRYEMIERKEQAIAAYEKAYEMNPENFRALFKIGIHYINKREFEKAEKCFSNILELMNLKILTDDQLLKNCVKKLSAIELEYVSKCYILLAKIALQKDQGILFVKYLYEKSIELADTLDENLYLKEMYPNERQYNRAKKCLERRLALKNIKDRLKNIGDILAE